VWHFFSSTHDARFVVHQKRRTENLRAAFGVGFFDASERILVYVLFGKRKYTNVEKYVTDEGYGAQNMND